MYIIFTYLDATHVSGRSCSLLGSFDMFFIHVLHDKVHLNDHEYYACMLDLGFHDIMIKMKGCC